MKQYANLFIISLLFFRCDFRSNEDLYKSNNDSFNQSKNSPMTANNAFQENILGRWVSHSSGKDTTIINKDSIFSFEWIKSGPYSIDSTIISIGDKSYYNTFLLSLSQDTLIFTDQDGKRRKFTRITD